MDEFQKLLRVGNADFHDLLMQPCVYLRAFEFAPLSTCLMRPRLNYNRTSSDLFLYGGLSHFGA